MPKQTNLIRVVSKTDDEVMSKSLADLIEEKRVQETIVKDFKDQLIAVELTMHSAVEIVQAVMKRVR
jgi:hypothetical protein